MDCLSVYLGEIMKITYEMQLWSCLTIVVLVIIGLHQDIFTIAEGILGFSVGILGFIHAGIKLILED